MATDALEIQIGGKHYRNGGMQPIELSERCYFSPSCFSILRYIYRHKEKNGKQDLDKALHYAEFIKKFDNWYGFTDRFENHLSYNDLFYKFLKENPQLNTNQIRVILAIKNKDIDELEKYVKKEIEENYPEKSFADNK